MRRTSAALLTLAAFLSTLAFVWSGLAKENARRPAPARTTSAVSATSGAADTSAAHAPTRDLFVFGDEAETPPPQATGQGQKGAASTGTPTPEPTPAPRARLIGFLRTATGPSAVLALDGAVEIAHVREERRGYRLLALDEEAASARLRTPEGEELELHLATPPAAAEGEGRP